MSSDENDSEEIEQTGFDKLAQKSKDRYMSVYDQFIYWKNSNNADSFSEDVFLSYFSELSQTVKPSSLINRYAILKNILKFKNVIDIGNYTKLTAFVKEQQKGFIPAEAKAFTAEEVEKFLDEAPDETFLAAKVALIFSVTSGCTIGELHGIASEDVKTYRKMIKFTVFSITKRTPRSFCVLGRNYEIVKKYKEIRDVTGENTKFFLHFDKGKCTTQPMGFHKLASVSRKIAEYLELPDAASFCGVSLKKTAAALLGTRRLRNPLEKACGNSSINEGVRDSKREIIQIDIRDEEPPSKKFDLDSGHASSSLEDPLFATKKEEKESQQTFTFSSPKNENFLNVVKEALKLPNKHISIHFHNCTFTNVFND